MTGYGRAENAINEKVVLVELRSLNGKQFELLLKLPVQLKPFEFEIRNMLSEQLVRAASNAPSPSSKMVQLGRPPSTLILPLPTTIK